MMPFVLRVLAGAAGGALFGVAFGALASVFHGGPTLAVGVSESWAWFAVGGALVGLGAHLARRADARSRPRSENTQPGSPDAR